MIMQQAGPLPSLGKGRREITDQSSHFTDGDLRPREFKVPEPAMADPRSYHGLPTHTVQCYFGYSSYGKLFIIFGEVKKGKEQNIMFWDSLLGFCNFCYPGLHDPGYGCLLMASLLWKVGS